MLPTAAGSSSPPAASLAGAAELIEAVVRERFPRDSGLLKADVASWSTAIRSVDDLPIRLRRQISRSADPFATS
jgi:hypothetical protein